MDRSCCKNPLLHSRQASRRLLACLLLLLVVCLPFVPLIPPSLVVSTHGSVLYETILTKSTLCEINFRHSYNKGRMREIYRFDPKTKKLTLYEGYFESYGAGMLDVLPPGATMREEQDFLVVTFPPNWVDEIGYVVGPIAQHHFVCNGDSLALYALAPQQQVILSVRRRSLYQVVTHLV